MNNKLKNEYIHRDFWTYRCNDNYIPSLNTDFHLVIPVDELGGAWSFYQGLHPQQSINGEIHETR